MKNKSKEKVENTVLALSSSTPLNLGNYLIKNPENIKLYDSLTEILKKTQEMMSSQSRKFEIINIKNNENNLQSKSSSNSNLNYSIKNED